MLTVSCWLWGNKFNGKDVVRLAAGVKRNLAQPHRFMVVTDDIDHIKAAAPPIETVPIPDRHLTTIKGCFARLRMFDPQWQREHQINDRLVLIDLDTVITGPLDPLFDRPESFVIMQNGNAGNPCKFNGALQMLRPGAHPEVWSEFSPQAAHTAPFYEFPDDQGWLWHRLPGAAGWVCGIESGVFVFHKPGWPGWERNSGSSDDLPDGARLVTFSGWRNPRRFKHLSWVREHWRDDRAA